MGPRGARPSEVGDPTGTSERRPALGPVASVKKSAWTPNRYNGSSPSRPGPLRATRSASANVAWFAIFSSREVGSRWDCIGRKDKRWPVPEAERAVSFFVLSVQAIAAQLCFRSLPALQTTCFAWRGPSRGWWLGREFSLCQSSPGYLSLSLGAYVMISSLLVFLRCSRSSSLQLLVKPHERDVNKTPGYILD